MIGRLFEQLKGSASLTVKVEHSVALVVCYTAAGMLLSFAFTQGGQL